MHARSQGGRRYRVLIRHTGASCCARDCVVLRSLLNSFTESLRRLTMSIFSTLLSYCTCITIAHSHSCSEQLTLGILLVSTATTLSDYYSQFMQRGVPLDPTYTPFSIPEWYACPKVEYVLTLRSAYAYVCELIEFGEYMRCSTNMSRMRMHARNRPGETHAIRA